MKRFERNLFRWQFWFDQSKFERKGNPDYKLRPPYLTGLRIMYVMTPYNILNMADALKWADDHDVLLDMRNCYSPEKLNCAYLPVHIKNDIMQGEFYKDAHHDFVWKILTSNKYDEKRVPNEI